MELAVHLLDLDRSGADDPGSLRGEERERAARLPPGSLRDRFLAAHAALRTLLANATSVAPADVKLGSRPCTVCGELHGKPVLVSPSGAIGFNLAHSGPYGLVGIGRGLEVGVDIELYGHAVRLREIEGEYLSEVERRAIAQLPALDQPTARLTQWVRKEALLKATGEGLNSDPRTVEMPVGLPGAREPHVAVRDGRRWVVIDLVGLGPALGAVAVTPQPGRVTLTRPGRGRCRL